jgi:hypothetical protein
MKPTLKPIPRSTHPSTHHGKAAVPGIRANENCRVNSFTKPWPHTYAQSVLTSNGTWPTSWLPPESTNKRIVSDDSST